MSTDAKSLQRMQRKFVDLCQYLSFTQDHITGNFFDFPSSNPAQQRIYPIVLFFTYVYSGLECFSRTDRHDEVHSSFWQFCERA